MVVWRLSDGSFDSTDASEHPERCSALDRSRRLPICLAWQKCMNEDLACRICHHFCPLAGSMFHISHNPPDSNMSCQTLVVTYWCESWDTSTCRFSRTGYSCVHANLRTRTGQASSTVWVHNHQSQGRCCISHSSCSTCKEFVPPLTTTMILVFGSTISLLDTSCHQRDPNMASCSACMAHKPPTCSTTYHLQPPSIATDSGHMIDQTKQV